MGDAAVYDLAAVVAERDALKAEAEKLRAENSTLRTLVAVQPTPCVYCGLTEMAKCASGFPGCARADDMICGEDETFKAVVDERNKLRAEAEQLRVQLAACGVAALCNTDESRATHSVERGAYGWSDSYEQVCRAVWREMALRAEVEKLRDAVSWHRCSTHGDVDSTAWGCPECVRELRAEVALRKSEVELFRDKLKARCDEVAKLRAACAAKDEAICTLRDHITVGMYRAVPHLADVAAEGLSTDAGKGWVDATGAVEATALWTGIPGYDEMKVMVTRRVPDDWAGATVKIVMTGTEAMAAIEKENDNV